MSKYYDFQDFNFKTLGGDELLIRCHTYEYSNGWGHRATILYLDDDRVGFTKRATYYNRTWESFKYESVLKTVINEFYNRKSDAAERENLLKQVEAISKHGKEEAEKWLESFNKTYNALSDKTKKTLAGSDIFIESKEQAEATIKAAKMLDILTR